jgi:hypothetical protein
VAKVFLLSSEFPGIGIAVSLYKAGIAAFDNLAKALTIIGTAPFCFYEFLNCHGSINFGKLYLPTWRA